jgi:hypothetical protein
MGSLLLFRRSFLGGLEAGISTSSELVLELFDPTSGVNELELSGVERMADVANVDLELFAGAACSKTISATASHLGFEVFWVDAIFHDRDLASSAGKSCYGLSKKAEPQRRFIDEIPGESTSKGQNQEGIYAIEPQFSQGFCIQGDRLTA